MFIFQISRCEIEYCWSKDKENKSAIYWYPMNTTRIKLLIQSWSTTAAAKCLNIKANMSPLLPFNKKNLKTYTFVLRIETPQLHFSCCLFVKS